MLMDHLGDDDEPEWRTGTAIDEFNAVYRAMAFETKNHRGFSPAEVDEMLVSTCAVLMGAGRDKAAEEMAQFAELARRRRAGENVNWFDLDALEAARGTG